MLYLALLYASLADPVYETRESATLRLIQLIDRHPAFYGPRLAEWTRTCSCPETRRRSLTILTGYARWRIVSYVPAGVPVWPCIDCFPTANPLVPFALAPDVRDRDSGRKWYALESHEAHCAPPLIEPGPYWHRYRLGTERMIRAMLRDGADVETCDRLLVRMWSIEQAACGDCTSDKWQESVHWRAWQGGYPRPRATDP